MKKVLSLVFALAFANATGASQPKLFTITATVENYKSGMALSILPLAKSDEKYFKKIIGKTATFQVPVGKYSLLVMQTGESEQAEKFIKPVFRDITVSSNASFKLTAEFIPVISLADSAIIDKFLISSLAELRSCEKPAVNLACAYSPLGFSVLNPLTKLTEGLTQTRPWNSYYSTGRFGFFEINNKRYFLIIEPDGEGSFVTWQLNSP